MLRSQMHDGTDLRHAVHRFWATFPPSCFVLGGGETCTNGRKGAWSSA